MPSTPHKNNLIGAKLGLEFAGTLLRIREMAQNLWAKGTPLHPGFTLHGVQHSQQVEQILLQILGLEHPDHHKMAELDAEELFEALAAVWLHDVGMILPPEAEERKRAAAEDLPIEDWVRSHHNDRSFEYVMRNAQALHLAPLQAETVAEVCRAHRGGDLRFDSRLRDHQPNSRFLAALVRLSDELDVSDARAPDELLKAIWPALDSASRWHWLKHWCVRNPEHSHIRLLDEEHGLLRLRYKYDLFLPGPEYETPFWERLMEPIRRVLLYEGVDLILVQHGIIIWLNRFEYFSHRANDTFPGGGDLEKHLGSFLFSTRIQRVGGDALQLIAVMSPLAAAALQSHADRILQIGSEMGKSQARVNEAVAVYLAALAKSRTMPEIRERTDQFDDAGRLLSRDLPGAAYLRRYMAAEWARLSVLGWRLMSFLRGTDGDRMKHLPYLPDLLGVRGKDFLSWVIRSDKSSVVSQGATDLLRRQ